MEKVWKICEPPPEEVSQLLKDYNPVVRQMLFKRGLTSREAAEKFLAAGYEGLNSPFLFQDMEKAGARIWRALENGEKITVYGDYDADAVTASAVLMRALRYLGGKVESYIPDRFTEGYGVNLQAVEKVILGGSSLIITVDCGTNSRDAAELCKKLNADLIITDHHEIIGDLPEAYALINPKNSKDNYPYSELTGVGVAYKLAQALFKSPKVTQRVPQHISGWEKWLLDFVAIGTVADCHSLMGENRILVKYGLRVLQKSRWPGLRALAAVAGLDFIKLAPDTYTLGFVLAPRLNAAGRLEHAGVALDLLLEDNEVVAQEKAGALNEINSRRQNLTQVVLSEAREQALINSSRPILLLYKTGWPKGVVGLVAGKLAEEFHKPTFVLEQGEEEATGSARTVGDFDVIEALKPAAHLLSKFGGHKQAAGLTLPNGNLEALYKILIKQAEEQQLEEKEAVIDLEAELKAGEINLETCERIAAFEPFGVGNLRPKFLISGLKVGGVKIVGAQGQHVQLRLHLGSTEVPAIVFNAFEVVKKLKFGDTVDVAAELIREEWNGTRLKLKIYDLKINQ